ncbi:hypothetical protein Tco_0591864 [Tanacetum coccineum]
MLVIEDLCLCAISVMICLRCCTARCVWTMLSSESNTPRMSSAMLYLSLFLRSSYSLRHSRYHLESVRVIAAQLCVLVGDVCGDTIHAPVRLSALLSDSFSAVRLCASSSLLVADATTVSPDPPPQNMSLPPTIKSFSVSERADIPIRVVYIARIALVSESCHYDDVVENGECVDDSLNHRDALSSI